MSSSWRGPVVEERFGLGETDEQLANVAPTGGEDLFGLPARAGVAGEQAPPVSSLHPLADLAALDVSARRQTSDEVDGTVEAARHVAAGDRHAAVDRRSALGVAPGGFGVVVLEGESQRIDLGVARRAGPRRRYPLQPRAAAFAS